MTCTVDDPILSVAGRHRPSLASGKVYDMRSRIDAISLNRNNLCIYGGSTGQRDVFAGGLAISGILFFAFVFAFSRRGCRRVFCGCVHVGFSSGVCSLGRVSSFHFPWELRTILKYLIRHCRHCCLAKSQGLGFHLVSLRDEPVRAYF